MGRIRVLALLAAGLLLGAPAQAATGPDVREVIDKAEQLRGLSTTHRLQITTLNAAGLRRVVLRAIARERERQSDAGWDDALHLLGVLKPNESLAEFEQRDLAGQVAGLYMPSSGRLYVLGAGGSAPRSVVVHEIVHALQDEHFKISRGPFAARPRDHDGELAATALVEGDATEVQARYVAALSGLDLLGELGRTMGAVPKGASGRNIPFLQRQLEFPYMAGRAFVQALRKRGGQRLLDRAFRHPPRTTAAVLDPERYLAGDPPPQAVRLPRSSYRFETSFGAEDLVALTGERGIAPSWLGGRLGVGRQGLDLRLAMRGASAVASLLERTLPASAEVAFNGRFVCVHIARKKASVPALTCR